MIRPTYRVWAVNPAASVKDPDLDASHPGGEGGNNKYSRGWVPEKEPAAWINYVLQQADNNFRQLLTQGHLSWDATVNYAKGAMTFHNGKAWSCLVANINQTPADASAYWDSALPAISAADWATFYAQFLSDLRAHTGSIGPTGNPHNDTITAAGGYTKAEIDAKFNALESANDAHLNDKNNPHGLTPAQVNCLSAAAGGIFTGLVTMYQMRLVDSDHNLNGLYGVISMGNPRGRLGIKDNRPKNIVKNSEYITESSYASVRAKHEIKFSTREPEFEIPLQGSLSNMTQGSYSLEFSRPSTLNYTDRAGIQQTAEVDEPAFTERGLLLTADTVLGIRTLWTGAATVQLYRDNVPELWDVALTDGNLITIVGTTGSINNLRVWQGPLTQYEKSTRGG